MNDEIDPERRFGGIARLYGSLALDQLRTTHVCVVGIGGVGSWSAEALARSGIGALTLIDLDHIAESNINRQIHALEHTLGQAKVSAMAERIAAINPACRVNCVEDFATVNNVADLLPVCDGLVDAIDQVRAKAAMISWCKRQGMPVVTTGGAGGRADPSRILIDDLSRTTQDALASKVRAQLRREYGFTRDPKRKFGIDCVYSPQQAPAPVDASCEVEERGLHGLNCAGYGSSAMVTASFGLFAAARLVDLILRADRPGR